MTLYRSVSSSTTTGVSLGHRTLAEADHWILGLADRPRLACTHLVPVPVRHVAISLTTSGPVPPTAPELREAATAAADGECGRAVVFPGVEKLIGTLTVARIKELSAIDRVEVLGSGAAADDAPVDTREFVRPQFRAGELVLTTTPAAGGVLVPFETSTPTPCCAGH
ncbi:hypothetical protein GCM10010172_33580 [Paractinoplanes ferrugineus]|uniref:Uncharacterized protein n=1 Tax=Paractinoplanes ferrugineus TaxID=113564 RepID=A0A919J4K6_9ACTN|nr:hypothetical protein [Actinoplanes ferrugineus]GIE14711.1 hypothetical protein Afe05nite_65510 [Actinoplanes ferrugineus]